MRGRIIDTAGVPWQGRFVGEHAKEGAGRFCGGTGGMDSLVFYLTRGYAAEHPDPLLLRESSCAKPSGH